MNEYDKSDKSSEMDARNLFIPEENYNDTANLLEDDNSLFQGAPSYVADYDYENDYNNTPLVYSFFPLVPGFVKKFDNSENNFNGSQNSITSIESFVVSNQDKKFKEYLEFNEHSRTHQNYETENLNNFDSSAFYQLDNSCNAMDINISRKKSDNTPTELSFGGKIKNLDINSLKLKIDKEKTEKERIHNESFEMLKKEDSSKMIFLNEKSPELFEKNVFKRCDKDNAVEKAYRSCSRFPQSSEEECELQILNKLNTSMNGICPPPSLTQYQMSLHDMLTSFKKNIIEPVISPEETQSNLFFKPSNTMKEVLKMEWPDVIRTKYHDIAYNKSTISEEIEVTCLRYCERFIGSETSSSFNNEVSSAKKRNDRLK